MLLDCMCEGNAEASMVNESTYGRYIENGMVEICVLTGWYSIKYFALTRLTEINMQDNISM